MYVGVLKITLLIRDSHSLKDKRAVVRRIKDRAVQKFGIAVAEVGSLDTWQRAELGLALCGSDRAWVGETLERVAGFVRSLGLADMIDDRRDVFAYGDDGSGWRGASGAAQDGTDEALVRAAERTGAGDKVGAAGDDDWIPAEWREAAEREPGS